MTKPLLKWPGGKHKLAGTIGDLFPNGPCTGKLLEAFTGSGALFLHLAPRLETAVLADANPGLINFHTMVRDAPDDLLIEVNRLPLGDDWRDHYYQLRARYNQTPRVGPAAAALLLWLNRTAFNGLYRENSTGGMNAPAGDYTAPAIPTEEHVRAVSALLELADIRVADFRATTAAAGAGDWLYLDPPYDPLTPSASFVGYAAGGFSLADQEALAEAAAGAAVRGARLVASNHGTARMLALWGECGFGLHTFGAKRSIGCKGATRGDPVPEILAWR